LALEEMMQRQRLRRAIRPRPIGRQSLRNDSGGARDRRKLRLEGGGLLAVGTTQSCVARAEIEDALPGVTLFGTGFPDRDPQDLAVALRRDRQAMIEVPGRQAAF